MICDSFPMCLPLLLKLQRQQGDLERWPMEEAVTIYGGRDPDIMGNSHLSRRDFPSPPVCKSEGARDVTAKTHFLSTKPWVSLAPEL